MNPFRNRKAITVFDAIDNASLEIASMCNRELHDVEKQIIHMHVRSVMGNAIGVHTEQTKTLWARLFGAATLGRGETKGEVNGITKAS